MGKNKNKQKELSNDLDINIGQVKVESVESTVNNSIEKDNRIKELEKEVIFSVEFFGIGESQSSRFVTSWATKEEDVDKLVELIKNLNVD